MDKIKIKMTKKQVERDVKYYIDSYQFSQKEAYALVYENYYNRLLWAGNYVEVEIKERIHNEGKENFKNKE